MVIFHSYVSLPEGTDPKNPTVLDVQVESRGLEGMIQGRTTHLAET